jgi:MFS family permease
MSPAYRVVTVALVLLTTMIAFEAMAVSTAMPRAAQELDAIGGYGLAFSSMMTAMLLGIVAAGIWADRSGPLPGLYAGQTLFAMGTLGCALASSWGVLIGGRVVTGVGAGLVIVSEFVAIGRVFPTELRPQVFTWLSAAWVIPSVVGAPVAGWLTTVASWRWVFGIVVVPAVVAGALVLLRRHAIGVPPSADESSDELDLADHRRTARLGTVVALSAGLVQLAIHERQAAAASSGAGAGAASLGGMLTLALIGVIGLLWATPRLLPAGTLVARRGLPSVIASRALFNGSFMSTVTFLPLMLVQRWELSLTMAGAVLATGSVGWSTGSWLQGRVRSGGLQRRVQLVWGGAAVLTVGTLAVIGAVLMHASPWVFAGCIAVCGLAMGAGSTTLSVLVLDLTSAQEHGRASAALQLSDVLGSVVGIGAATAIFAGGDHSGRAVYLAIYALLAVVAALAVVTGLRCMPSHSPATAVSASRTP